MDGARLQGVWTPNRGDVVKQTGTIGGSKHQTKEMSFGCSETGSIGGSVVACGETSQSFVQIMLWWLVPSTPCN